MPIANETIATLTREPTVDIPALIKSLHDLQATLSTVVSEFEANIKKPLEARVKAAEKTLYAAMRDNHMLSCSAVIENGLCVNAEVTPMQAGTVTDWDALYAWITANSRFDLLHKRLASTAVVAAYQEAAQDFATALSLGQVTPEERDDFIRAALPDGTSVSEWNVVKLAIVKPRKPRKAS